MNKDEKVEKYCLTIFDLFKSSFHRWNERLDEHTERVICRLFYHGVFDSYADRTILSTFPISNPGKKVKGATDDHFVPPQTFAKFIMDTPKILDDYNLFKSYFNVCRKTITVTKEENLQLRELTKTSPVLTKDKYYHLGMKLYHGYDELPTMNQVLPVLEEFTIWENKFIKNDFRPTVVYTAPKAAPKAKYGLDSFIEYNIEVTK